MNVGIDMTFTVNETIGSLIYTFPGDGKSPCVMIS